MTTLRMTTLRMTTLRMTASACVLLFALPLAAQVTEAVSGEPTESVSTESVSTEELDARRAGMARALFNEGVEHAREARFAEAADRFRRALALRPAPPIAYNLASALAHLGRLVEASEALQWVIRHEETTREMLGAAEVMIGELEPRFARVDLRLEGDTRGVAIVLDGHPLADVVVGVPVPMDPGPHVLAAMRGSERVAEVQLALSEGGAQEVTLTIPAPSAPVVEPAPEVIAPPPPPPPPPEDLTWLLWTGVAVGAAALLATVIGVAVDQTSPVATPIPGTTMPPILVWE